MQYPVDKSDARTLTQLLQSAVAPRPIGLVSTVSASGEPNLAPFSFFGLMSLNPPVVTFSPVTRLRDGSTKHTLDNIKEVRQCVIHMVEEEQVGQMNLCAVEYGNGISEFEKSGFTREPAISVQPPLIKECRIKLECEIDLIHDLDTTPGAGSLVVARVVHIHIDESLLDKNGRIDTLEYYPVARLGGDWYTKVSPLSIFKMPKPNKKTCIGMDRLPAFIKDSPLLSLNHKARLALADENCLKGMSTARPPNPNLLYTVRALLAEDRVEQAWSILHYEHTL